METESNENGEPRQEEVDEEPASGGYKDFGSLFPYITMNVNFWGGAATPGSPAVRDAGDTAGGEGAAVEDEGDGAAAGGTDGEGDEAVLLESSRAADDALEPPAEGNSGVIISALFGVTTALTLAYQIIAPPNEGVPTPQKTKSKDDLEREKACIVMWEGICEQWEESPTVRPPIDADLRRKMKEGVPMPLRGRVWEAVSGAAALKAKFPEKFSECLEASSDVEEQIKRDLSRTMPDHKHFSEVGGLGQNSLFDVLKAYAVYDPEVGYCQGMGFIVAVILLQVNDSGTAFWVLVALLDNYNLRDLFLPGLPLLCKFFAALSGLIEDTLQLRGPDGTEFVDPALFATAWFMTLFVTSLPFDCVLRVWDLLLVDGVVGVFSVSMAVLQLLESDLNEASLEDVLGRMRELRAMEISPDTLIELSEASGVTEAVLEERFSSYDRTSEAFYTPQSTGPIEEPEDTQGVQGDYDLCAIEKFENETLGTPPDGLRIPDAVWTDAAGGAIPADEDEEGDWQVDINEATDADGWSYAVDYDTVWHSQRGALDYVRRRRHIMSP